MKNGRKRVTNDVELSGTVVGDLAVDADNKYSLGSANKRMKSIFTAAINVLAAVTTFASVALTSATNQIVFGGTTKTTLNSIAPVSNQVITVPDSGVPSSSFLLADSASAQTMNSPLQVNGNVTSTGNIGCSTMTFNANGDQIYFGQSTINNIKTNRVLMVDYSGNNRWVAFTGLSASTGSNRLFVGGGIHIHVQIAHVY
jgi:type 1 fimbria pilin